MNDCDKLDVDIIGENLDTQVVGSDVLIFQSTASTNDIAWEHSTNPDNNGLCVFAENQTAGRGRRGNKWLSASGQSLLCSVLFTAPHLTAEGVTLGSAVATALAISETASLQAKIKWPNDIIVNGKKIAGILVESRRTHNSLTYVIGIGINCHQNETFFDDEDLAMPATSIDNETQQFIDRNSLATQLITKLDHWLQVASNDIDSVVNQWKILSTQLLGHVTLEFNQKRFSGNCIGIDPAKGLILQMEDGQEKIFNATQTTIVKADTIK